MIFNTLTYTFTDIYPNIYVSVCVGVMYLRNSDEITLNILCQPFWFRLLVNLLAGLFSSIYISATHNSNGDTKSTTIIKEQQPKNIIGHQSLKVTGYKIHTYNNTYIRLYVCTQQLSKYTYMYGCMANCVNCDNICCSSYKTFNLLAKLTTRNFFLYSLL